MPTKSGIGDILNHPIVTSLVIASVLGIGAYSLAHYVGHKMQEGIVAEVEDLASNQLRIMCKLKLIPECQDDEPDTD